MDYLQYSSIYLPPIFTNKVLNLIINGLPSIPSAIHFFEKNYEWLGFKPYYKWITFNTLTKGIDGVFMVERSLFYMVAKIEHFSVFWGF